MATPRPELGSQEHTALLGLQDPKTLHRQLGINLQPLSPKSSTAPIEPLTLRWIGWKVPKSFNSSKDKFYIQLVAHPSFSDSLSSPPAQSDGRGQTYQKFVLDIQFNIFLWTQ